jgi:hypothetical protein
LLGGLRPLLGFRHLRLQRLQLLLQGNTRCLSLLATNCCRSD